MTDYDTIISRHLLNRFFSLRICYILPIHAIYLYTSGTKYKTYYSDYHIVVDRCNHREELCHAPYHKYRKYWECRVYVSCVYKLRSLYSHKC